MPSNGGTIVAHRRTVEYLTSTSDANCSGVLPTAATNASASVTYSLRSQVRDSASTNSDAPPNTGAMRLRPLSGWIGESPRVLQADAARVIRTPSLPSRLGPIVLMHACSTKPFISFFTHVSEEQNRLHR